KTLLMAGLWTEVCLAQTAISALADGYRVFFVSDCSGGLTVESHEDAKRRLLQAGPTPTNWVGVVCEWAPDFTSDERHKVNPAVMKGTVPALRSPWNRLSPRARRRGGHRTRTEEQTHGETDRPREQVLRCVG